MDKLNNINWVDGMKINKSHFIHNDKLKVLEQKKLASSFIKSYETGLLPTKSKAVGSLLIQDNFLQLVNCKAITAEGLIINLQEDAGVKYNLTELKRSTQVELEELMVVLKVDPFVRTAFGIPDAEELPPRQPFTRPEYSLTLVGKDQLSSVDFVNNSTIVGRVIKVEEEYEIDEFYLPPVQQVNAHQGLLLRYKTIESYINDIGLSAAKVVQNARSKKRRGEINDLAENTFYLMEKIVFYLAQHMDEVRTLYKEESPMVFVSFLKSFGRQVLTSLRCMKNVDREALLRYYESHLGLQAHQFETDFRTLSQLEYNHLKLNEIFDQLDHHIGNFAKLIKKAIDLEYHSVERVDVINEKTIKKNKLDIF